MDALGRDLLYAFRSLRRQPGFAAVIVLTLAIGIGANTAVFSVLDAVVFRPLPYDRPHELHLVRTQFPTLGFDTFNMSPPEFLEFREHNRAFASAGAFVVGEETVGTRPPSRRVGAAVTADLFPTLGIRPLAGRWFEPSDSAPGADQVAILSFELWQREFGRDLAIIGQPIRLGDRPARVVGIMPRHFDVNDEHVELWAPLTIDPATLNNSRSNHYLTVIGRLAAGVTIDQARADIDRLVSSWREIVPQGHVPSSPNHRLLVDQLQEEMIGGVRRPLLVLQAAVGFVLLIACANLANLLIARANSRAREYAVRTALGASTGRLFRQLTTEGLVLAGVAALVGVGLAWAWLSALLSINPDAIPRTAEVGVDVRVLAVTLATTVATALVFGLVPLAHLFRQRIADSLRNATTRVTAGGLRARVRSVLVVVEVALAVLLVVGAGLLIRSFANLTRVNVGFDRANLTSFQIALPAGTYDSAGRLDAYRRLLSRIGEMPGVLSVAAMTGLPPLRNVNANDTDLEHIPNDRPAGSQPAQNVDYWQIVSVGYTETMGIPVIEGRSFELGDTEGAPVALVNETLARRFFGDRSPLGYRLKAGFGDESPWLTIVGVLADVKQGGLNVAAGTELYLLVDQRDALGLGVPGQMNVVVRSRLPLDALAPAFRQAVADIDPGVPVANLRSMDEVIGASVVRPRFLALLLTVFAALALALAAVGTYGILSYLVTERLTEIGIRMALGASRPAILRLVIGRGLLLAGAGLVMGLVASLWLSEVLATMLFGVTPTDPATLAGVACLIAVVALAACLVPAWRALRVSPLTVLRES